MACRGSPLPVLCLYVALTAKSHLFYSLIDCLKACVSWCEAFFGRMTRYCVFSLAILLMWYLEIPNSVLLEGGGKSHYSQGCGLLMRAWLILSYCKEYGCRTVPLGPKLCQADRLVLTNYWSPFNFIMAKHSSPLYERSWKRSSFTRSRHLCCYYPLHIMPYLCYCLNDLGILVRLQERTRDFLISEASRMTRCPTRLPLEGYVGGGSLPRR